MLAPNQRIHIQSQVMSKSHAAFVNRFQAPTRAEDKKLSTLAGVREPALSEIRYFTRPAELAG